VLPEAPRQLLLRPAELCQEPLVGLGGLDRVEILAEQVLDQPQLERLGITRLPHDRRYPSQPGLLGCPPPPLAHKDLVLAATRPDHQRLEHPGGPDGRRELVERLLIEAPPRLLGIGDDTLDRQFPKASPLFGVSRWQEGAQTPSECAL